MPRNKRHHYVPRFYLKRFSTNERSVNLFNLKSGKKICGASLREQCYRDYFYGKDLTVEKALSLTESEIADLMRVIDEKRSPPPFASPAHFELIIHILMQHGRTKYTANAMTELVDKFTKLIFRAQLKAEMGIDLDQFNIGYKDTPRLAVGVAVSAYPLLMDLQSKLLIDRTGEGFITSDHPVVLYNQLLSFREHGSNCGFSSKGLQIFLPLHKEKLFVLYDGATYRVGADSKQVVEIDNPRDIYELNTLQMCSANENVYFTDSTFNVHALYRKARPYMRSSKIVVRKSLPRPEGEGTSELIGGSMSDIRTNLALSFVTLRKSARRWRVDFRSQRVQPVVVTRNEALFEAYRDFTAACARQEYDPSEFMEFMAEREGTRDACNQNPS